MITVEVKKKINVATAISKTVDATVSFTTATHNHYNVEYRIAEAGQTVSGHYEVLAGAVNGTNKRFTVPGGAYVSGKLEVEINGSDSPMKFIKIDPANGIFDLTFVPQPGIHYIKARFINP